jgi:methylase of polypeptide subunit release factors
MRLLVFGDIVEPQEAERAVGADLLAALVRARLVVDAPTTGVMSPFHLNLVNELFVICDDLVHGGKAVMGAGQTTADLAQAAYPRDPVASMLDLGCGAGTVGLLFSPQVERCVGTDINDRALVIARVNASLNDVSNLELRAGDLFEPVADETFDLIVSQPPFVALPRGRRSTTFLHGGERGDELALRLLSGLTPRIRPGGRAYVLVEWPIVEDGSIEQRVRSALGSDEVDVLILELPGPNLDDYCTRYAAGENPQLGKWFVRAAIDLRDHLERLGVREIRPAFAVVARPSDRAGWTSTLEIQAGPMSNVTSARIDSLVATHGLLAGGDDELARARLRITGPPLLVEPPTHSGAVRLRLPPHALLPDLELNADAFLLVSLVDDHATVEEAARAFVARRGGSAGGAWSQVLGGVREALARGALEPRR